MYSNKAIGGYFELETGSGLGIFHESALPVNSGRNALELILRHQKIRHIQLPFYCCDAVLEPLRRQDVSCSFYHINHHLWPEISEVAADEAVLLVNYFGILNHRLNTLGKQLKSVVLDQCQAFFAPVFPPYSSFYSPRKFFGVADGGLAVVSEEIDVTFLEGDVSHERCSHLLKRADGETELGFPDYKALEAQFDCLPLKRMSNLTLHLLESIDYQKVLNRRNDNFTYLHLHLKDENALSTVIDEAPPCGPMVYPFLNSANSDRRERLQKNRIYVARYWPNLLEWLQDEGGFEEDLYHFLIPLPIDQRYNRQDMDHILDVLLG